MSEADAAVGRVAMGQVAIIDPAQKQERCGRAIRRAMLGDPNTWSRFSTADYLGLQVCGIGKRIQPATVAAEPIAGAVATTAATNFQTYRRCSSHHSSHCVKQ